MYNFYRLHQLCCRPIVQLLFFLLYYFLNEKYLHYEGDSVYVDVLDEKERVKKKYVKIGISDGRNAQIVSGIDSLSQIVELD